jgi:hypothetical protein
MKRSLIPYPYCAQCGTSFPADANLWDCPLCVGHSYPLVSGKEKRKEKLRIWKSFYLENDYRRVHRKAIPKWRHLLLGPAFTGYLEQIKVKEFGSGREKTVDKGLWRRRKIDARVGEDRVKNLRHG